MGPQSPVWCVYCGFGSPSIYCDQRLYKELFCHKSRISMLSKGFLPFCNKYSHRWLVIFQGNFHAFWRSFTFCALIIYWCLDAGICVEDDIRWCCGQYPAIGVNQEHRWWTTHIDDVIQVLSSWYGLSSAIIRCKSVFYVAGIWKTLFRASTGANHGIRSQLALIWSIFTVFTS